MKKVLFTATVDSHILHFHLPFLKLFHDNGYEVHVATNGNENIPYCDVKHIVSFERNPIKINNLKAIKQLEKIINKEKFDIIHTHTPMGATVTRLAAKKARKKYNTRVIYTAHGFHFYKGASIKNWIIFYPIEKWLSKYTDTLILINKEDYNLAKNRFFKKCKDIQYVPGVGIDENKFNFKIGENEKKEIKKSLGLSDNDFVLTYIARLDENKNQGFLIDCMKNLIKEHNNIHLLLIGLDELHGKYQEYAKDILKNVHFLGYRRDIPQLLKITDVAVSASLREGLPVNIMEAMASGLPVIAVDARGVRDLILDGKNGFVIEKNNKEEFSSKVLNIFDNNELKNSISKNNLIDIKRFFLNDVLEDIKKIYFKKKKILQLLASNSYSGAENVVCTIMENLKNEYDIVYCAPNGPIKNILKEKNLNYYGINKLSIKNLNQVIKDFNPDIIHAHDFKASIIASRFSKKCRIISHIHKNDPQMERISLKSILYLLSTKHYCNIIGVSDSILKDFKYKDKIENKYLTLYNYVDKDKVVKLSKEFKVKDKYDLFFFGRLSDEKNPIDFIEIIKKLNNKNIKCLMIGDGPLKERCIELIKEYSLESNIDIIGFQTNPFPYIKASKIGIMPSKYEGFGLSAIESIILNKPVFNSGIGGLKEIFKNDEYFLCKSIEEYLNKIKDYNGSIPNISEDYFDKNKFKMKLMKVYEET